MTAASVREPDYAGDPAQDCGGQRPAHPSGRAGRGTAGAVLPWVSGDLVVLAPSAEGLGRGRLPRGRGGYARLWRDRAAARHRPVQPVPPGGRHGGRARRVGRSAGGDRGPRLGRARGLERGADEAGPVPRGGGAERAPPPARQEPAHHGDAAYRRRHVLPALFPGARRGGSGAAARRGRLHAHHPHRRLRRPRPHLHPRHGARWRRVPGQHEGRPRAAALAEPGGSGRLHGQLRGERLRRRV